MKSQKIGILIIIIGAIILSYPIIANIVASHSRSTVILNYQEQVQQMTEEQIKASKEKAKQYNESLTEEDEININLDNTSKCVSYLNVLDVGNVMGYISIPKFDIYLPIYHGTNDDVLQSGVGHVENTSFPIGEKGTHAVLAGHTGLVRTQIFDDIDKMEIGDKFYIHILNEKYCYEVDQIKVVEPDNNKYVGIEKDGEYVTLLTCTPYGINSHRLLVRGTRIELSENVEKESEDFVEQKINTNNQTYEYKNIIIIISVLIPLLLIIVFVIKKDRGEQ